MAYDRIPDSDPSGINPMFCVPEWRTEGRAYIVLTRGFRRKDPDVYFVCVGGDYRPAFGPLATAEMAEHYRDQLNACV